MTKQEALEKIEELKRYVLECDVVQAKDIRAGQSFKSEDSDLVLVTEYGWHLNQRRYFLSGLCSTAGRAFSSFHEGVTAQEVADYFNEGKYKLVSGRWTFIAE